VLNIPFRGALWGRRSGVLDDDEGRGSGGCARGGLPRRAAQRRRGAGSGSGLLDGQLVGPWAGALAVVAMQLVG
jgi:hypothetical protein